MIESFKESRYTGEQGARWPKKKSVMVLFVLALIWAVLTLLYLQSNFINNHDYFRPQSTFMASENEDQQKKIYLPRLIYLGTTEELIEHTHQMKQQTKQREIDVDEHSLTQHAYIANDKNYKQVNFRNREFDK